MDQSHPSALVAETPHMPNAVASRTTPAPLPTTPAPRQVTVRRDDTLSEIAARNQTTVEAMHRANPHISNVDFLLPGQVLALPAAPTVPMENERPVPTLPPPPTASATTATQGASRVRSAAAEQLAVSRVSGPTRLETLVKNGGTLQQGARGPEVLDLQRFLGMKRVNQDSDFGPQTRQALETFQRQHGVAPDGVVGADTLAALKKAGSAKPGQAAGTVSPPVRARDLIPQQPGPGLDPRVAGDRALAQHVATGVLREGDSGETVRSLQRLLGFSAAGQTGVYGSTTRAAVETFQSQHLGMGTSSPGYGQVGKTTLAALTDTASSATVGTTTISARGRAQMQDLVKFARANHQGGSRGDCMAFVWSYMTRSGYGKLDNWNDLPGMDGALARGLPDYVNASAARLKEAGLQRLDTATNPPIKNPHDSRIPPGAVIVVAPGSTGTRHPTAGDIVVRGTRSGEFINDGPAMNYGTQGTWYGRILGVYVPE
jgi:peptidoglycan hydrolase-like protein with peptidoglycan-binding domain